MSVRVTCERGVETPCLWGVEKGRKIDGHSVEGKVMRWGLIGIQYFLEVLMSRGK